MNFYYDPILGLQYDYLEYLNLIIDTDSIPKIDVEEWFKMINEIGIMFVDTSPQRIETLELITNYKIR